MAREKHLDRYPSEYFIIFRMAVKEDLSLTLSTPLDAVTLRNNLYAFRSVIYQTPEEVELAKDIMNLRLTVQSTTLTLTSIIRKEK